MEIRVFVWCRSCCGVANVDLGMRWPMRCPGCKRWRGAGDVTVSCPLFVAWGRSLAFGDGRKGLGRGHPEDALTHALPPVSPSA